MAAAMEYDVFISYAQDGKDVAEDAVARLEAAGLRCWIAPRNIGPGQEFSLAITDGIKRSRLFLLIFSGGADQSRYVRAEVTVAFDEKLPILPLRIEDVPAVGLRLFMANPQWVDATQSSPEQYGDKLVASVKVILENMVTAPVPDSSSISKPKLPRAHGLTSSRVPDPASIQHVQPPRAPAPVPLSAPGAADAPVKKVAISYKRNSKSDEYLLRILEPQLKSRGFNVFIDRHVAIGMQWASEISEQIKSSDALVILLSETSVQSEMVHFEAQLAHDEARLHNGRPQIIPVRVQYSGELPDALHAILSTRQYFLWSGEADDQRLMDELVTALRAPTRPPVNVGKLEASGGAVQLDSPFYMVRAADEELYGAIERRDSIICIKGARQMGKTSLLARGLRRAKEGSVKTVFADLQSLNGDQLATAKAFYIAMADQLADKLNIDASLADLWNDERGANSNFERFVKRQVLAKIDGHLLWAIDEVDRLFTSPFGTETFALFRTWHNARVVDPSEPWSKLTLAIAYATEAHLFITNINQSPFNVGTRLELEEFTLEQVADLNRRHGTLLAEGAELSAFFKLVHGHPFLVRRGLDEIARKNLRLADFEARADSEDGPYGDHLRRILVMLAPDAEMTESLIGVLYGRKNLSPEAFYRLRSAGLIRGETAADSQPRCALYDKYLRRHLPRPTDEPRQ